MGKKKKETTPATNSEPPALKIGSRVRCDDGVGGRITRANAVSVKIKWDDGEEITWRRDSLAWRAIEILDADATAREEQPAAAPVAEQVEQLTTESAPEQGTPAEQPAAEPEQVAPTELPAPVAVSTPEQVAESPATEPAPPAPEPTEGATPALAIDTPATATPESAAPAKPKRERKAKTPTEPQEKKGSALAAAARVLAEAGTALTCKEMIGAMAIKGYWSSPGGKTPDATLCSAILREIKMKGEQSRFIKAAPGRFTTRPTA
jgi:HB1, ASXL, restriction endonuclease HTH domain